MKNTIFTVIFSVSLLASNIAYAGPVYRETFQFCTRSTNGTLEADLHVGWKALRKLKTIGDGGTLKSSEPGSPNKSLKAFKSAPIGDVSGNVLWTKATTGLTIFTDEFSFDIGSITRIEFDQRFDGLDPKSIERDGSKIALLIDGTWYISDKTFNVAKRSVWESIGVDLSSLTFGTVSVASGVGPSSPLNSGLTLPVSGSVTAFGIYVPRVNDRVRIDNFTLKDSTPEDFYGAGEAGDLSLCPSTTGSGTPVPTPKADTFCSDTQLKTLGSLRLPGKLKKDVVTSLPARTLKGKRDQALLSLVVFANPRIDLLTNMIVGDYDISTGFLKIPATVRPDGFVGIASKTFDIKLNSFAKKFMNNYIKRYARDGNTTKPLFPRVDRGTEKLITTALCTKQFRRLIRLRAERAGIRIKFNL